MFAKQSLSLRWDGLRHTPVFINTPQHATFILAWTPLLPHWSYLNRGAGRRDRPLADSDCLSHGAKLLICLLLFPDSEMFISLSPSHPTDTDIGTYQYYDKGEPGK